MVAERTSNSESATTTASPLAGIRVLDLTQGISGPFASKVMAVMGADVIKVEPPGGDVARTQPPFLGDDPHPEKSGLYLYLNTNKRSITLDLEQAAAPAILRRLYESADVVIEDSAPGWLAAHDLGYETLERINPRAVMVSVTPFGQYGPYRDYQATDLVALALGGLLYISGEPTREPLKLGGHPSEYFAGLSAFSGALIALYHRDATGEGQHVDVAQVEGIASAQGYSSLGHGYIHEDRKRMNAFAPMYRAKDGFVGAMFRQDNWADFCEMMGRPDLTTDPRFADQLSRRDHMDELNAIVAPWMAEQPKEDVYHAGQAKRMPMGYICDPADMLASAQYQAHGYFTTLDHPVTGPLQYPGMPMRWGEDAWDLRRAPLLGEHNQEVYGGLLGYTPAELVLLRNTRVI